MSVRRNGGMADAYGSGPYGSNTVWVQVPSSAVHSSIIIPPDKGKDKGCPKLRSS